MDRRRIVRLMAGTAAAALLPGITGCADHAHTNSRVVYAPVARPPDYYEYYYYQDARVYYHIHTGNYYYHFNGAWRKTRQRPGFLYLDDRRRHKIVIRENEPYIRHEMHVRRYPPRPAPPGNAYGHRKGPVPPENRGVGYDRKQPQMPPGGQDAGRGIAQPGSRPQLPPGSQGAHGQASVQPPRDHGTGGGRPSGKPGLPPQSGSQAATPAQQQIPPQNRSQPPSGADSPPREHGQSGGNGRGKGQPGTCDSGPPKGKGRQGANCE